MALTGANLSEISSNDTELSFKVSRNIEYDFDPEKDKYFAAMDRPLPYLNTTTYISREQFFSNLLEPGYMLKRVASERTRVKIVSSGGDVLKNDVIEDIEYYIQTIDPTDDGQDDDVFDGGGGGGVGDPQQFFDGLDDNEFL